MYRLFGYFKKFPDRKLYINPSPINIPDYEFQDQDWSEFYPDAEEELPDDAPSPRGPPACMVYYVDVDHAHDVVTRCSITGVVLMVNNMPVKWILKRQQTIETSSYGSKLVAAQIAIAAIIEFCCKLRMLGVRIFKSG